MNFIKKYSKIVIGAAVLIVALFVFTASLRTKDLSGGSLKNWLSANNEERIATVQTLIGSDENRHIVACFTGEERVYRPKITLTSCAADGFIHISSTAVVCGDN